MLEIQFEVQNRTIQVEPGTNLRQAAINNKLSIYPHMFKILNCRGRGLCTSCKVKVVSGKVDPRNEIEQDKLKNADLDVRLACQITVQDNLVVKSHL